MDVKVFLLKSFGINESGGNPAGVVLNTELLNDEQKKIISKKVGFSETAFIEKSDKADYKVRFFTPTEEVDLCGHATIATYSLLFQKGLIMPGNYTQELKVGVLEIKINNDGTIIMEQSLPKFSEFVVEADIRNVFNKILSFDELKPQVVSTGLRDIILHVKNREILDSLIPDLQLMTKINKKTNSIGFHVFTFDTYSSESVALCRNFAPLYGINEESATGSSNGALACYLYKYDKLNKNNFDSLVFEQGYSMNAPSNILVKLEVSGVNITKVWVGGRAILFGEKEINI